MMKKPPGLWLLLSAGVLWLCFQDVSCVRATSLIFAKSTTTTTSTTAPNITGEPNNSTLEDENAGMDTGNSSKSLLTGIPQVDYQWDPNLPRELNGYNLTEYPFYDRLPEEIDFKCDGLHDGFYASVPHKCQVYHHCLFGTRYDFLCANYTAFDQKTFICHFVSEVDCANSKKFWHRNDALYKAQSTTTLKPLVVYTPPAPPAILSGGRTRPHAPQQGGGGGNLRRRKPARRRRPQYDYYDDYDEEDEEYYDEQPRYTATEASGRNDGRRRNKRPRPRPRPVYDEEYEEYEDERYERRRAPSRRARPILRRNKDERRKYEDEYEEYEDEDPRFDHRSEERRNKKNKEDRRRPIEDERKRTDDRDRKRDKDDEDRRPSRPRKGSRRPIEDDDGDEDRKTSKQKEETTLLSTGPSGEDQNNQKPYVKPPGSSVYDRPRVAPRIRPPVPKNEADKYAYKTTAAPARVTDEEYYEDYEEETTPRKPTRPAARDRDSQADASITSSASNNRKLGGNKNKQVADERDREDSKTKAKPRRSQLQEEYDYEEEDEYEKPRRAQNHQPKNEERRVGQGSRKRPADYANNQGEMQIQEKPSTTDSPSSTTRRKYANKDLFRSKITTVSPSTSSSLSMATTEILSPSTSVGPKTVRIVKRPFLPSRGGNPYIARGLQPVGLKSEENGKVEAQKPQESQRQSQIVETSAGNSTQRNKSQKGIIMEDYNPVGVTPRSNFVHRGSNKFERPTKTDLSELKPIIQQEEKEEERNPLDIPQVSDEYDVTLNDALNPTLPNLPLRPFPSTTFAHNNAGDNLNENEYTFSAFHRPRYVVDATVNSGSQDYPYRYKLPQMVAVQTIAHLPSRQSQSHQDLNAQYSHNSQQFRPGQRIAPTHTHAFLTSY